MFNDRPAGHRLGRFAGRAAAVLVALALAFAGPAAGAPSPSSPGKAKAHHRIASFGIGPATAKGADGRSSLNYVLDPGSRLADHVIVHNFSDDKTLTLLVYAADATTDGHGGIGFQPRANPGTDSSRWITFAGGARVVTLTLHPGKTAVVPLDIVVPTNASPGDHLAGVFAGLIAQAVGNGQQGQKLNFEQRVAVRALFRVSGEVRSQLAIENLKVAYHGTLNPFGAGNATVSYVVRNAGNVLLSGNQRVAITGLFGNTGSTSKLARLPLLLPGARFPVQVEVHHVWPQLVMRGRVTITPLGVTGAVDPGLRTATVSTTFRAVPWTLLGLVVVFAFGVVLVIVWRRRLNARPAAHSAGRTKPEPALGEA